MLPEPLPDSLAALAGLWLDCKEQEAQATADRRRIEDRIKSLAGVLEAFEGTETLAPEGYQIKIVGRFERKVDSDKLQELAAEHGLTEQLSTLFRWTPAVNMKVWKSTDSSITAPLAAAITTTANRPSFKIEKE